MIFLVDIPNRPGSLCALLTPLSVVNITRIESRAVAGRPGTSQFLLEIDMPPGRAASVLAALTERATQVRLLVKWPDTEHGYVVPPDSENDTDYREQIEALRKDPRE